jgi:hypothetical protein
MNRIHADVEQGSIMNDQLSDLIIGCAYTVSNTLGAGFLEKVHENAFAH